MSQSSADFVLENQQFSQRHRRLCTNTGLLKMIVGVLTTCHTQYNLRQEYMYFFYLLEQHSKFLLHTLQVLCMCTLCDSTETNTIIELVPNCLQHVSGDGFNGGSDSYLQFRDTCGKRRNINLIEINYMRLHLENEVESC